MKKFVIAILICLVIWGVVVEYREHRIERLLSSGDTVSPDGSAPSSGTPSGSDAVLPAPEAQQPPQQPVRQVVVPVAGTPPTQVTQTAASPMPGKEVAGKTAFRSFPDDTIGPNPPNGTAFTGTGHFQLYRQGNLTWRLNTDNGQSCVLFATEAEWRKPRVYEHGCAQS